MNLGRYEKAVKTANELGEKGISLDELCIAKALETEFAKVRHRLSRSKKCLEKLALAKDELLDLAVMTFVKAVDAVTHKDVAASVVEAYLASGMDIAKTSKMTCESDFALKLSPLWDAKKEGRSDL